MISRWLSLLLGITLLGVGSFALAHPEYAHGGGLVLLGLATLEQGSRRARRLFRFVSTTLDDKTAGRQRRRRARDARPVPARPRPRWQPVT